MTDTNAVADAKGRAARATARADFLTARADEIDGFPTDDAAWPAVLDHAGSTVPR